MAQSKSVRLVTEAALDTSQTKVLAPIRGDIADLKVLGGLNPGSPNDASTSNFIETPGTLTHTALSAAIGEKAAPTTAKGLKWAIATDPQWGIKGDGVTDDSAAINAMLQAVFSDGEKWTGGIAYFPGGPYIAEGVELRSRVTIRGAGKRATTFKAKPGGTATAVFTLRAGAVQAAFLEDLEVLGNGNAGQHGIRLTATGAPGGWWEGGMRRVRVSGFSGHQIWLEGGVGGLLPHQFLVFEHVEAFSTAGLHSLHITGQVGQVEYIGCQFEGRGINLSAGENSVSVYIDALSYAHTFHTCTFQENLYGLIVTGASPVTLIGCYWENIGRGVLARSGSRLVTLVGSNFSNAAGVSDGSGYVYRAEGGSFIISTGTKAGGTVDKHYSADINSVVQSDWVGPTVPTTPSVGSTKQIAEAAGNLSLGTLSSTVLVNASATTITTITGYRPAGASVFLRAQGGTIKLGQTGNISTGRLTGTLTVPSDAVVHLVRFDIGGKDWIVVGMSPASDT